ncbi:MAG: putative immunity protein [Bacteroidota bacterium]
MRDQRFIAEHRGGPLTSNQHKALIQWAMICAQHVLPLITDELDDRIEGAVKTAEAWTIGEASVGDAREAAKRLLTLAKELSDETSVYVVRAFSHGVATAHMADHSLGAALYALRAVKSADKSVAEER